MCVYCRMSSGFTFTSGKKLNRKTPFLPYSPPPTGVTQHIVPREVLNASKPTPLTLKPQNAMNFNIVNGSNPSKPPFTTTNGGRKHTRKTRSRHIRRRNPKRTRRGRK